MPDTPDAPGDKHNAPDAPDNMPDTPDAPDNAPDVPDVFSPALLCQFLSFVSLP